MRLSLDPKRDYILAGNGEKHTSMAETPVIKESLEKAFAHFCLIIHAESPAVKSDAFSQIEGARRFIDLWLNFGRIPEPVKQDNRQLKPLDPR